VILVPRREGVPERDAIWAYCRARWERLHPDLPIYEGHHDEGPFNRSAALNLAAELADRDGPWDTALVIDADVIVAAANVVAALERAEATGRVTWAFQWWAGTTPEVAASIMAGETDEDACLAYLRDMHAAGTPNALGVTPVPPVLPPWLEKINPISWSCAFAVPRAAWETLGGFDERFAGWGWEDMAFQAAACGLVGHERIPGALVHLWHPRSPGLGDDGVNKRRNRQLGRRYMVALRAKGYHDRPEPSTADELERDRLHLMNLARQEETDRAGRPVSDLPDWSDWWPPLEDLVASWKRREVAGPPLRIALVVRSGGPADRWPARSAYLREMLDSLAAHVDYPAIVARVIFSDWPEAVAPELEAIAAAHGFYVVGEADERGPDFTRSMVRLWRYLASRRWPFDQVLLVEDDFRFERPVPLEAMASVLAHEPRYVQVALLRDACYPAERERGGILGHPEAEFTPVRDALHRWLEHRRFFTLNPCLFRRGLLREPWPTDRHSEAVFGRRLFADPDRCAVLWGEGEAWVTHLGEVRAGAGY
jgi:hypothetical protein